jgi:putative membrane protein
VNPSLAPCVLASLRLPTFAPVRPATPFVPEWSLHPSVLIGVAALGALYFWGIRYIRRRFALGPPVQPWRPLCFGAGLLVMLLSLNGPIHDLSDNYLFSIHMAQHLLLTMVLPPLLIAGVPGWLVEPVLRRPAIRSLARFLVHPVVAGVLFSVTLLFWHTVDAYDLMMRNHDVHVVTHLTFMVTAVLLWWPVMSPAPSLPRLGPGLGMLYLFVIQLPMQLLGAIITFADDPLYTWYLAAPRTWGLSPLDDQKLGGLLMWVPGNVWIWGAMSLLFFEWARKDR